jgi:hypothetical protein
VLTYNRRVAQVFSELVEKRIAGIAEGVLAGQLDDIARYKFQTGKIAGLRDAFSDLEEAIAICEGKTREKS